MVTFVLISPLSSKLFLESDRKTLKYISHLEGGMFLIYVLGLNIFKHRRNRSFISTEPWEIILKAFLECILYMSLNDFQIISIMSIVFQKNDGHNF